MCAAIDVQRSPVGQGAHRLLQTGQAKSLLLEEKVAELARSDVVLTQFEFAANVKYSKVPSVPHISQLR